MTQTAILELQQVTHVYVHSKGAFTAVENIDLQVAPGEFLALVGPSGCGKTTVLNLLAGLFLPTVGAVLLEGEKVAGPSPKVGYMLQQDYLFPWRTIQNNTLLGLEIQKTLQSNSIDKAVKLLDELGLPGTAQRYSYELSGGMRQRAALARTLVTEPQVLLLDEPFSALDFHIKLQLEELVKSTLRRLGKTAVLVTHDLQEAAAMCDRIIVLQPGPGRIHSEIVVPDAMRQVSPQMARSMPQFLEVLEQLTAALQSIDTEGGGGVE
ncbi:ABC transporter ATP-binding protein [Paenibacillus yanchengensis]|uniref:ABC transporter ATP-binding protein n=1 Tax=Paenibacillus yanchengensis TaxID=2035833 RepID=A0ABW4YJN2_9BACL